MSGDGTAAIGEADLRSELERLGPFHHRVELPYGLSTAPADAAGKPDDGVRVDSVVRHAFPALTGLFGGSLAGKRVLDVACNCGGFSFAAARAGADRVLGFDIVERYIEQANLIRRALDVDQPEFRVLSIDDVSAETTGRFDVVLCLGILYHLENPVGAMRRLAAVAEQAMLVDTNITHNRFMRKPYWRPNVPPLGDEKGTAGAWRTEQRAYQFTPSAAAVEQLLEYLGFSTVRRLPVSDKELDPRYHNGRRATFLAVRG
jgi:tRNA (mo5U34)-methyltransferase